MYMIVAQDAGFFHQGLANGMASTTDEDAAGGGGAAAAAFYNYVDIEIRFTSETE